MSRRMSQVSVLLLEADLRTLFLANNVKIFMDLLNSVVKFWSLGKVQTVYSNVNPTYCGIMVLSSSTLTRDYESHNLRELW